MRFAYLNAVESSLTDWKAKSEEMKTTKKNEHYQQPSTSTDEPSPSSSSSPSTDLTFTDIQHLILIPNYKEHTESLMEILTILSSHTHARTSYQICLAMEESEKNSAQKAEQILEEFKGKFASVGYTVHPLGLGGEVRGKSSNVAWAAREMVRRLYFSNSKNSSSSSDLGAVDTSRVVITVMDADSCLAEDYFGAVTYHYVVGTPEERAKMFFSSCMVFDR
jgi:cellulose synthase/poly-beta-1,6-N-acetylglucosamine synthase-like glycosyltransferase